MLRSDWIEHDAAVFGPAVLVLGIFEHRGSVFDPSVLVLAKFEHRGGIRRKGGARQGGAWWGRGGTGGAVRSRARPG